jgi:hypothetical protein
MIEVTPHAAAACQPGWRRVAATIRYGWWRKETLWFDMPELVNPSATDRGNAWLMALLPFAFESGHNLKIDASVDAVLLQNTEALQRIWSDWFPGRKPVRILAKTATPHPPAGGRGTGCFFTGGVDSFFTVLHRPAAVDALIYVWGCDIPLSKPAAFAGKVKSLDRIAAQLKKEALPMATNLRETRAGKVDWGLRLHGPALGAAGFLLGPRLDHILISGTHSPGNFFPWGSHPLTTPLMSTSTLGLSDYGSDFSRFDKTAFIADSAIALENLHVCWKGGDDRNCGKCGKCYALLATLELLGRRSLAATFQPPDFSLEALKALKLLTVFGRRHFEEIIPAAHRRGRTDVAEALAACLITNQHLK